MVYYGNWAPYVPVAERKKKAAKKMLALKKSGQLIEPVLVEGRIIAKTYWGKAWCDNIEKYSDFFNRLARGKTYVRNGSVLDLKIGNGKIDALVNGSSIYTVNVKIKPLEKNNWKQLIEKCSGQIESLVELLQGKFSRGVMQIMAQEDALFPNPKHISMSCSCPDSARLCKHIAAVLYGVGARLDQKPELFFQLRDVNHAELLTAKISTRRTQSQKFLKSSDLSELFGIELDEEPTKKSKVAKKKLVKPKAKPKTKV